MTNRQRSNSKLNQSILVITAIIFSGLCWYFGNELSGDFWYLVWIAPIPILIISFKTNGRTTFIISFISYLIGRLSWFSYLVTVATIVPAIIFTLILSLIFALIMIVTRRTVNRINSWYSIFTFPVFFTTFEFLLVKFSPDSTAGSIAYTQSNFLPIIQIVSLTGILGISFLLTFIPSSIAIGWYYRNDKVKLRNIAWSAAIISISVFIFGMIRISGNSDKNIIKAGLIVLEEKWHNMSDHPDFGKENLVTGYYAKQISNLARQGAILIVLPERAINMNKETDTGTIHMLSTTAKQNHVFIIIGYTNFRNNPKRNSLLVINAEGNVVADYNKVHLVTGLESQFTPGNEIGLFEFDGIEVGTAICKDLDFPDYIKKYGMNNVGLLCIPAWDFVTDDWLHSRMAILRGVENGFSEVRAARQGRLTISDWNGRVTYEAKSSNGQAATLLGNVSMQKRNTLYTRFGEWFGIVNLIAAFCFLFIGKWNKRKIGAASTNAF